MPQFMPTNSQLLGAGQQLLPDKRRQSLLHLKFAEAVPERLCDEFYRLSFSQKMLGNGEADFYEVQIMATRARHRITGLQRLPQTGEAVQCEVFRCDNAACSHFMLPVAAGPVRGVVRVIIAPDFIAYTEEVEYDEDVKVKIDFVDACVLALDRRYDDATLVALKRTAFNLGEMIGIKIV